MTDEVDKLIAEISTTMSDEALVVVARGVKAKWRSLGIDPKSDTAVRIAEAYAAEIKHRGLNHD